MTETQERNTGGTCVRCGCTNRPGAHAAGCQDGQYRWGNIRPVETQEQETREPEIAQYVVSVPAGKASDLTALLDSVKACGFIVEWFRKPV
jgi:hypothetical protein